MSITLKVPHASVEAGIEIYSLAHGYTWRSNFFDSESRTRIDELKHAGEPFEQYDDAVFDAEREALARIQALQADREGLPPT